MPRRNVSRETLREALKGFCPVAHLRAVASNSNTPLALQVDCCKALLPYLWPKMIDFEISGEVTMTPEQLEERAAMLELMKNPEARQVYQDAYIKAALAERERRRLEGPKVIDAEAIEP